MSKIIIDNKTYEITEGKNLLETCLSLGENLPYFCWHPALGSVGACRQCAVKVFKDESDTRGRIIMSCMEPVKDGMRISVGDNSAKAFREQVVEWLMTNHPHDCPVCDEGGSCHLQDMTVMTGHDYRRYNFKKRTYRNQYLGPFIHHEMNRCIQCYRCVRFYKDYAGGDDLNVFAAHNHVYFGRAEDGVLQSPFSGNLAEVCPTGVFTDKTLKEHYTRKWDLTSSPSVCMNCSLGCNIMAGERYGELRLITNRYHPEINGYFICDRGRFGYEYVNDENRIRQPLIRTQAAEAVGAEKLTDHVKNILASSQKIIGVGSSRASLESNYALQQLVGKENFFNGTTNNESELLQHILQVIQSRKFNIASLKDVEKADAIIIIGEDITNTAPMLALSVRQALYKTAVEEDVPASITPQWHDAAVRNLVQNDKGYLCVLHTYKEEMSEIAHLKQVASPEVISAMVQQIIASLGAENEKDDEEINSIAHQLKAAKHPLIIAGTGLYSLQLLKDSTALADALKKKNENVSVCFVAPACNSIGLAMMNALSVEKLFNENIDENKDSTLIILENDLYRSFDSEYLENFFSQFKNIIVLDSLHNQTTEKATVLISAATFAEANGTLVNNEARAQAFFKVLVNHPKQIRASWEWINDFNTKRKAANHKDLLNSLVHDLPQFSGVEQMLMHDEHINGEAHVPMAPHRYSGRTAMLANISVHEPKPITDEEFIFSTTMEGDRQLPPSPLTPFYWWPGWNSVQALNHYQREVGGLLKGEAGGIKLQLTNITDSAGGIPTNVSDDEGNDGLTIYPRYHLFGSDELSVYTKGVADLSPKNYITLNRNEALKKNLNNGDVIEMNLNGTTNSFKVLIDDNVANDVALVPYCIKETHGVQYPLKAEKILTE